MTQLKLTDDEKDSFNLKWGETFPSINPELIDCLGNTIEESIQTTQSRIIIIRQELEKQEFVLDYLKKLQLKKLERPHSVAPHPLTRAISHTTSFKPLKKLLSTHSRDSFCSDVDARSPPFVKHTSPRAQSVIQLERIYDEPFAQVHDPADLSTLKSNASADSHDTIGSHDDSTDDEEPLYYNVLLMKHQSEYQNNNGYANDDSPCEETSKNILDGVSMAMSKKNEFRSLNTTFDIDRPISLNREDIEDQRRFGIINNIMNEEMVYTTTLDVLRQYKLIFENHKKGGVPFLNLDESQVIFSNIPQLYDMQRKFTAGLKERIDQWRYGEAVGELFYDLAREECPLASDYLKNYHQAILIVKKCAEQNEKFRDVTQSIPSPALKNCSMNAKQLRREPSKDNIEASTSLEELLYMPVVRIQRHSLTLNELILVTPAKHVDYDILQRTLKLTQDFLENFNEKHEANTSDNLRYLAKQGLTVQQIRNRRTLRHLFLFRDVIVCSKQRISGRQKIHYDLKWSIPLCDLEIPNNISVQDEPTIENDRHNEITAIECRVSQIQNELKLSIKRMQMEQGSKHLTARSIPKNIEKLQKKLAEQEASLLKIAPHLILTLTNRSSSKCSYSLLMSSDYERSSWKDMILGLQSRVIALNEKFSMPSADLQLLINNQKKPNGSRLTLERSELGLIDDTLFGLLNITIYNIDGLESNCDSFCVIETDSFGHFSVKAKTSIARNKSSPVWNEGFEIDLEGTQTLRILSYKLINNHDVLLGKCALELSREWLRGEFTEKKITLNEKVQITISLKYTNKDYIKRTPSTAKGVVFGAKLRDVVQREGKFVPIVISSCIEEVERRGIDEIGIYRVSGLSVQIQNLKKAFDKNSRFGATTLKEYDINVITSLLKLYFRELPEALFTDELYPRLMQENSTVDPLQREKRMISLVKSLPQSNLSVIQYILKHIIVISEESSNKMNLSNLSTVFGPTLLKPALKANTLPKKDITMEMFSLQARDAINQTEILQFLLTLSKKGVDFGLTQ